MKNKILWAVPLVYLLVALFTQLTRGTWQEEFGGHADEAAHYVTGLMVRDYTLNLAAGRLEHPMRFAERYYLHYPKVALGHWPPLFYAALAPWMLALEPARLQLMLFMALLTAVTAAAVFATAARLLGRLSGFMAGLFFLGLPLTRQYGAMLMSDMLNAGLCFAAAVAFGWFLDTTRRRHALTFGALAAAAVMTKGSALALALLPPLGVIFTGRWVLLRRPVFWAPAAVVAVLCAPWYLVVLPMMANGFENPQSLASSLRAILFYVHELWRIFGPLLLFLAVCGALAGLRGYFTAAGAPDAARADRRGTWASLTALALAVPAFHCIVTNAYDARYLLPALPALVILILGGARVIYLRCRERWGGMPALLATGVTLGLVIGARLITSDRVYGGAGYGMIASDLAAESGTGARIWLVSSDARGEGMFIAQTAMRDERRPSFFALRASKMLAESLWDGREYQPRFADTGALKDFLLSLPVHAVITDETIPADRRRPHHALLKATLEKYPEHFRRCNTYPLTRDGVFYPTGLTVYKTVLADDPVSRLESTTVP